MTLTVTLSAASGQTINVDYTTSDGTATAGNDYSATIDTLTFAPGQTNRTFTIPISDDTVPDPNEIFFVTLSNPVNAILGTPSVATDPPEWA